METPFPLLLVSFSCQFAGAKWRFFAVKDGMEPLLALLRANLVCKPPPMGQAFLSEIGTAAILAWVCEDGKQKESLGVFPRGIDLPFKVVLV